MGYRAPAFETIPFQQDLDTARLQLNPDRFHQLLRDGRLLPLDLALNLASTA
jgi:hypothetical protein